MDVGLVKDACIDRNINTTTNTTNNNNNHNNNNSSNNNNNNNNNDDNNNNNNKNDKARITDLHQGIVWGTNTDATDRDPRLTNRFDYDGDYGTVLNRFLMQAAIGYPLTVHGTGGQTRAFIHIRDSVRCVQLALENPPEQGERVKIFNQMTESHQVGELAKKVAALTGAQVNNLPNPRNEAVENDLIVDNRCFIELGLNPTTLDDGLLKEVVEIATRYADRCDRNRILCTSAWTKTQAQAIGNAS